MAPPAKRGWRPWVSPLMVVVLCAGSIVAAQPVSRPAGPSDADLDLDQMTRIIRARKTRARSADATPSHVDRRPGKETALPTTRPAGAPIVFTFDNAPYSVVFDYIERITGLPIIGDRALSGTVTYFSRKGMTLNEAMTKLNLLLKDKGVVVVRVEDYLRIGKFPDVLRNPSRSFTSAEDFLAADVTSNEVVRVFFMIGNQPADEVNNLIAEAVPLDEVKLAAWKTTNRIQVVALADRVRQIIALARTIDAGLKSMPPGLVVRTFHPRHILPSVLAKFLQNLIPPRDVIGAGGVSVGAPDSEGRGGAVRAKLLAQVSGANDPVSITHDDAAGIVVVRAPGSLMDHISELVEALDVPGDVSKLHAEVVAVKHGSVKDIVAVINNSLGLTPGKRGQPATGLTVSGNEVNSTIALVGQSSLVAQARRLIEQIDVPGRLDRLQRIPLKVARANEIVNNVLIPYYRTVKRPPPVAADKDGNSIVTWTYGKELADLKALITELDQDDVPEVKTWRLDGVNVGQLANTLRSMFGTSTSATFGADPSSGILIVAAKAKEYERIEPVIEQLRARADVKTFRLEYAQAGDVAKMVMMLYGGKGSQLRVVPDEWSNTLMLAGVGSNLASIEQLIKTLDRAEPVERESSNVAVIQLKSASAADACIQIQTMLGSSAVTGKKGGSVGPTIEAAASDDHIIVVGQPKQIERVRQLAEEIDQLAEQLPDVLAVRPIQKVSAERLAQMLKVIIPELSGADVDLTHIDVNSGEVSLQKTPAPGPETTAAEGRARGRVVIGVDKRNNTLLIRGRPRDIEQIDDTLATLTADIKDDIEFKTYVLEHADPVEVATSLEGVFNETRAVPAARAAPAQPPKGKPPAKNQTPTVVTRRIRAVPAMQMNAVIVRADPRDFDTVAELIEVLDKPRPGNVRIFRLTHVRADVVAENIRTVFQKRGQPARRTPGGVVVPAEQVSVAANAGTNSIIVSAGQSDLDQIEEIVHTLDQEQAKKSGVGIHVVQIKSGNAERLAPMINNLVVRAEQSRATLEGTRPESVQVSAHKATNTLIVAGSVRQHKLVQELVDKLDTIAGTTSGAAKQLYIVPVRNVDPNRAKQILERMIPRSQSDASDVIEPSSPACPTGLAAAIVWSTIGTIHVPAEQVRRTDDLSEKLLLSASGSTTRPSSRKAPSLSVLKELIASSKRGAVGPTTSRPVSSKARALPVATERESQEPPATQPAVIHKLAAQISGDVEITALPEQGALVISCSPEDYEAIAEILALIDGAMPRPKVEIIKLKNARAVDVERVLWRIYRGRRQPPGMPQISFSADQTSNSIIISGGSEIIKEIRTLVAELDSEKQVPDIEFRTFTLKNAQASEVVPRIQEMLRQILSSRGIRPDAVPFNISADDRTNTIIVTAPVDYLDQIQKLINVLDSVPSYATVRMEIIRLKHADARSLGDVVNTLLSAQGRAQRAQLFKRLQFAAEQEQKEFELDLEKPILILPDQSSQSVAICSTPDNVESLKAVVALYDTVPLAENLRVRIFPLQHADATELVGVLSGLFKQGPSLTAVPFTKREGGVPKGPVGKAVVYNVAFAGDARSNTIVVCGSEESIALVEVLITQLDKEKPAELYPIRLIAVEHADADKLAAVLQDMMDRRVARAQRLGVGRAAERMSVIIRSDKRSNSLLVSASPADFEAIEELVRKLDSAPSRGFEPILVTLNHLDAIEAADMLQEVFRDQARARREHDPDEARRDPAPVVIADVRSNSLIICATTQGAEEALRLIEQLDQKPHNEAVKVRLYLLKWVSPASAQPVLEKLFDDQKRKRKAAGPTILVDDRMHALIVYADESDHETIAGTLAKIDQPGHPDQRVKVFPVHHGPAENVKKLVDEIYTERRNAGAEGRPITISVDGWTNSLAVNAAEDDMKAIGALIERIDGMPITKKMQVAVVPIKSADAKQLAEAITQLMEPGEGQRGLRQSAILEFISRTGEGEELIRRAQKDEVFVYGDEASNLLIVVAPEDSVKLITALAEHIDRIAPSIEIRIFELKNADATRMKKTLDELLGLGTRAGREARGAAMTVGEVSAPVSRVEREALAVMADARTNSLIVAGTPTYLSLIEEIVKKLDAKAIEEQKTEVIHLKNADAENIEKRITSLINKRIDLWKEVYGRDEIAPERLLEQEVNIVADPDSQKIILQASPRVFDSTKNIIQQLDEPPPQVMIQALLIEVTLDDRLDFGFEAIGQDLAFTKGSGGTGIGAHHDVVVGTDLGTASSGPALAGFTFSLHSEDFNLLLRALQSEGKVSVLSRPQVMARDNALALLSHGQKVPRPTSSVVSGETGNTTSTINYEPVSIQLEVTPHVNPDEFVSMDVRAEISRTTGTTIQISEDLSAPVFSEQKVETEVIVKDGETVVIGGLITTRKEQRETKVPFLGDIPVIGLAFKSIQDVDEKTELLIVLTPRVVSAVDSGPARRLSEYECGLMDLLPIDVRESPLMGTLRIKSDDDKGESPDRSKSGSMRLFDRPAKN